jgi:hypothetical protein
MKIKYAFASVGLIIALVGCASPDYSAYTAAHAARSAQEAKRLDNIASIARESNDPAARIAAIITLSHAEAKAQDKIEKPTSILVEAMQAGAGIYGTWINGVLGVLNMQRTTTVTAIDPSAAANALTVLTPALK